jgi:hypothetical protein
MALSVHIQCLPDELRSYIYWFCHTIIKKTLKSELLQWVRARNTIWKLTNLEYKWARNGYSENNYPDPEEIDYYTFLDRTLTDSQLITHILNLFMVRNKTTPLITGGQLTMNGHASLVLPRLLFIFDQREIANNIFTST